jgi:hypothetical protein
LQFFKTDKIDRDRFAAVPHLFLRSAAAVNNRQA